MKKRGDRRTEIQSVTAAKPRVEMNHSIAIDQL